MKNAIQFLLFAAAVSACQPVAPPSADRAANRRGVYACAGAGGGDAGNRFDRQPDRRPRRPALSAEDRMRRERSGDRNH